MYMSTSTSVVSSIKPPKEGVVRWVFTRTRMPEIISKNKIG